MDLYQACEYYVTLLSSIPGLKALLVDAESVAGLSLLLSQTEALRQDVVLIEQLHPTAPVTQTESNQSHITGVVLVRPTAESVQAVRRELAAPRFGTYCVMFTNVVRRSVLEELADADATHERVASVQEVFLDFVPLGAWLAVCRAPSPKMHDERGNTWGAVPAAVANTCPVDRQLDALFSVLLTLGVRPQSIRFLRAHRACRSLAERLAVRLDQESKLFNDSSSKHTTTTTTTASVASSKHTTTTTASVAPFTTVLILDRREDPVTPLLTQWTYEAMVHELFGLHAGVVQLPKPATSTLPPGSAAYEELVLDSRSDEFYAAHAYSNYGDIGVAAHEFVAEFQRKRNTALCHDDGQRRRDEANDDAIEEMMRIVESYPEFRKQSLLATKHISLIGGLSREVKRRQLMQLSQLEQDIACYDSEPEQRKRLLELLGRLVGPSAATAAESLQPSVDDLWRVAALFALRYEQSRPESVRSVRQALQEQAHMSSSRLGAIDALLASCGAQQRSLDLFENRDLLSRARNTLRRGLGNTVENVYTQHEPLLARILEDVCKNRWSAEAFEEMNRGRAETANSGGDTGRPHWVMVFMVGGVTAEEARTVAAFNGVKRAQDSGKREYPPSQRRMRFFLLGDTMHNSHSFIHTYAI